MLVLLSPSKTLDESPVSVPVATTEPKFLQHTRELHTVLKEYDAEALGSLMGISDKLSALNYERYQAFNTKEGKDNAKPALFMFKGDVYDPIPVADYDADTLKFAQAHIRILSGFYGLLRPLDTMQPYRLEMGTRLENARGKNLYDFWGSRLSEALNEEGGPIINLASEEYAKAIDVKALKVPMIQVQFKEYKNNGFKIIGLMAKRARGMMTDYIVQQRIKKPDALKKFDAGGYRFRDEMSDDATLVFARGDE